jgi:hypothetical protein
MVKSARLVNFFLKTLCHQLAADKLTTLTLTPLTVYPSFPRSIPRETHQFLLGIKFTLNE